MNTGLSFGLIVVAAVAGYWAGGQIAGKEGREAKVRFDERGRESALRPAKNASGPRAGKGERAPAGRAGGGSRNRSQTLRAALERLRGPETWTLGELDPFGDQGSMELDRSRDLAMIFQAAEGDFPAILDYASRTDEEGSRIWQTEILHRMIRRWCDFSPEAALAWLGEQKLDKNDGRILSDPFGDSDAGDLGDTLRQIIAEEALDDRPDWALALMEDVLAEAKNSAPAPDAEPDPFGYQAFDSNHGSNEFLYLFAKAHPERALELLERASGDLAELGFTGWMAAIMELGRMDEINSVLERIPEAERSGMRAQYLEALIEREPESALVLIEAGAEGADMKMADAIKREQGREEALAWFMSRASAEDLEDRVASVVRYGFIRDFEERVAWVERMRGEGAETGPAFRVLVELAAEVDIPKAYGLASRAPAAFRGDALEEIFEKEIKSERLWVDGRSADLYQVSPEARVRAREAGYEEELLAAVRDKNGPDWKLIVGWLEKIDANWEAIAPRGPLQEPELDPFAEE